MWTVVLHGNMIIVLMPDDLTTTFQSDKIYICQYSSCRIWYWFSYQIRSKSNPIEACYVIKSVQDYGISWPEFTFLTGIRNNMKSNYYLVKQYEINIYDQFVYFLFIHHLAWMSRSGSIVYTSKTWKCSLWIWFSS